MMRDLFNKLSSQKDSRLKLVPDLVGRWDNVLKIDEDTSQRNRLDVARILVGVKKISDIPRNITIFLNGASHVINILVSEYEDERCWIDAVNLKGQQYESSTEDRDEEDNCHIQDFILFASGKTVVSSPKKVENDYSVAITGNTFTSKDDRDNQVAAANSVGIYEFPRDPNNLIGIPIRSASVK
ncbi:hypothetical protein V6N11_035014 [Hibiscus sabdariffa]|uniref:Uncharacterized protein n=1 Tax=Hibiscus sabdariffa TaxID=183260 RepID=A0ABR2QZK3_9ROSI